MLKHLSTRLWNTNPLWIIGFVLMVQCGALVAGYIPATLGSTMLLVMALAYLQNTTYGLQSRSANRNSNAYHAFAALAANFTFFWSLQLLVRNELPPSLLVPYVFATILGTLHGNAISIKIESILGLSADGAKGRPQFMKLWPTVAILVVALMAQLVRPAFSQSGMVWVAVTGVVGVSLCSLGVGVSTDCPILGCLRGRVERWIWIVAMSLVVFSTVLQFAPESHSSFGGTGVIVLLLALTIVDAFSFSMLRVARSTDHYWFHTSAVVLNLGIGFLKFLILINNRYDWALFLPTTTGSIIGSLVGANYGQELGKKLKATFDAHVTSGAKVVWPMRHLAFISLGLVVHAVVYGIGGWKPALVLLLVSAWQAVSFTMVSRARQRNNAQYLAWCSVFSNGVWYICMHYLAMGKITWEKAAPYIIGNAGGSLIGQNLSMQAERATGALMDQPVKTPKPATAIV